MWNVPSVLPVFGSLRGIELASERRRELVNWSRVPVSPPALFRSGRPRRPLTVANRQYVKPEGACVMSAPDDFLLRDLGVRYRAELTA